DGLERKYQVLQLDKSQIITRTATEITGTTKNRLYPSDIGMLVTDFLHTHFDDVMNYGFTADIEKRFDKIADGDLEWPKMLSAFYGPFHADVEKTLEEATRATGERVLGKDPDSGHTVVARISRYGKPIIMIGKMDEIAEGEKPRFANLKIGQSLETINYEDAMELFKLPSVLGQYKGQDIQVSSGRFGPYIKLGDAYVNLPPKEDVAEMTLERALELIEAKEAADAPIGIFKELPVTKGKGRFGPFVKWSNLFVNIPRAYSFDTLTMSQAAELIEAKLDKEANKYIQLWEKEKISVENGRWGPFIRFGKLMIKLPKLPDGGKMLPEHCINLSLDDVKAMIEVEYPDAFKEKKPAAKKPAAKKPAAKKAPAKKAPPKKG
ncbi:MAG: topoisomerase C-terminal repeat-containing protein, partial [Saprospiraceae bacterium]